MKLEKIKEKIEAMSKFHQIEVLRILNTNGEVVLNENKNGVFINLTHLQCGVLAGLVEYTEYVDQQQSRLQKQEHARVDLERQFFNTQSKSNKEIINIKINHSHGAKG
jgi:hypothetical protein